MKGAKTIYTRPIFGCHEPIPETLGETKRKEILMKMSLFASKLENCFHHFILGFTFSIVLNQRLWIIHKWPMVCEDPARLIRMQTIKMAG